MKTIRPESAPVGCRADETMGLNCAATDDVPTSETDEPFTETVSATSGDNPLRQAGFSSGGHSAPSASARTERPPTKKMAANKR